MKRHSTTRPFPVAGALLAALAIAHVPTARADITEVWTTYYKEATMSVLLKSHDAQPQPIMVGHVNVGPYNNDAMVRKYDTNGSVVWTWTSGLIVEEYVTDAAVDAQGNIVFCSMSGTPPWNREPFEWRITKLSPTGTLLWSSTYWGPGQSSEPEALAVDASGNVYVTGIDWGTSGPNATAMDFATAKWSPDGQQLWIQRVANVGQMIEASNDIAVTPVGDVYIVGQEIGPSGNTDAVMIKYNTQGQKQWEKFFPGPGNTNADVLSRVVIDAQGNINATGMLTLNPPAAGDDAFTVKVSPAGTVLWQKQFNGKGNGWDRGYALTADAAGNVFVTGESWNSWSNDYYDIPTIKYTSAGVQSWVKYFNGPTIPSNISEDWAYNILIAPDGQILTIGSDHTKPGYEVGVFRYDQSGNLTGELQHDLVNHSGDVYWDRAWQDGQRYLYVALTAPTSGQFWPDAALVKIDLEGAGPCYADCDASGSLSIDDFICFQTWFAIGLPESDCDGSFSLTIDDFICFQTLYAIGC